MGLLHTWHTGRRRRAQKTNTRHLRRRLTVEPLEDRSMLATLGLGIHVRMDADQMPGGLPVPGDAGLITEVQEGDIFWIEVLAEDQRADPQGVISLPLNLSWDSDNIQLISPVDPFFPDELAATDPILTSDFPLDRFVDAFVALNAGHVGFVETPTTPVMIPSNPNIDGLRGGALPNANFGTAIGIPDNFVFSQLQFRAVASVDDTPFTMQVAGSMSFADAAVLDGVNTLSDPIPRQNRDPRAPVVTGDQLAVTEFLDIVPAPDGEGNSISGFVYLDTDLDGDFRAPQEIGLPNVTVTLQDATGAVIATQQTGPGGEYLFDDDVVDPGISYTIIETQPLAGFVDASITIGQIVSTAGTIGGTGVRVPFNQFSEVVLDPGEHAVDYNFGENKIAIKPHFLASTDPRQLTFREVGLRPAKVTGTAGDDVITITADANSVIVTGGSSSPQAFAFTNVDIVTIDAGGGDDRVTIEGSNELIREVATLTPDFNTLRRGTDFNGTNFGVLVLGAEQVIADARLGDTTPGNDDLAVIRDSTANDQLVAGNFTAPGANTATFTTAATSRSTTAGNFARLRAISAAGGTDTATEQTPPALDFGLELLGDWN